jgi:hypothetical protein
MVLQIAVSVVVVGLAIRRRDRPEPSLGYALDRPTIELTQEYGAWNAEAYDAGTGRDHSWSCRLPVTPWDRYRR